MFIQKEWIEGDPGQPPPPPERKNIRNKDWKHMHVEDILSMPDKWEYPFFAIWDSVRVLSPRKSRKENLTRLLRHHTGLPLHSACDDRPGVRQEAARYHDSRMVHEARRRAARLRMELWRRQPAGARLVRRFPLSLRPLPVAVNLPLCALPGQPSVSSRSSARCTAVKISPSLSVSSRSSCSTLPGEFGSTLMNRNGC